MNDLFFSEGFFSLSDKQSPSESEKIDLEEKITAYFYPELGKPLYYEARYNDEKDFFDFYHSDLYPKMLAQINRVLSDLRRWGREQSVNSDMKVFDDYYTKLANPSLGVVILFSHGKRILESIALGFRDPEIELGKKQVVFLNLVENSQLAKCVDGCYSHLLSIFQELQSYKPSHSQINQWTYHFVTNTAKKVMLQRPYAVSENYMGLIYRLLSISLKNNEYHVMNYFLEEARIEGYPLLNYRDPNAQALKEKLSTYRESKVIRDKFLSAFKKEITVSHYIEAIEEQLRDQFATILQSSTLGFSEKVEAIHFRLNQIGLDPFFLYYEILDYEPLRFRHFDRIRITLSERLIYRDFIKKPREGRATIEQRHFKYVLYEDNNLCDWFQEDKPHAARFLFMDLLSHMDTEELTEDLQKKLWNFLLIQKLQHINQVDLLSDLLNKDAAIATTHLFLPIAHSLLQKNPDPLSFLKFLSLLPEDIKKSLVLTLEASVITDLIHSGISLANNQQQFLPLALEHKLSSEAEALEVTQGLLLRIKERRQLANIEFKKIPQINYLSNIDFSYFVLDNIQFLTQVEQCGFLFSHLNHIEFNELVLSSNFFKSEQNIVRYAQVKSSSFSLSTFNSVYFSGELSNLAFKDIDLSSTSFTLDREYRDIDLLGSRLTEIIFNQFVSNGLRDFSYAYLENINLGILKQYKNTAFRFEGSHMALSNLEGTDLMENNFFAADLRNANLLGTRLKIESFSPFTRVEGAELDFYNLELLFRSGIKKFMGCRISLDSLHNRFVFSYVNLQGALFIGGNRERIYFKNSILDHVTFTGKSDMDLDTIKRLHFIESTVVNLRFEHAKIQQLRFRDCFNTRNFVLEDVIIETQLLFRFYQLGLLDFTKVKGVMGYLPPTLPQPSLNLVKLSKEAFLGLYQAGLRNFEKTNLQGFYLGEILLLRKISEIDLKLAGTQNNPTYLTCLQTPRTRRSVPLCRLVFLIYNPLLSAEEEYRFNDLMHRSGTTVVRKIFLNQDSIWLLNNPDELVLYWRYRFTEEEGPALINFLNKLTKQFQRNAIYLHLNYDSFFLKEHYVSQLAFQLRELGFIQGKISFESESNTKIAVNLQGIKITPLPKLGLPIPKGTRPKVPPATKLKEKVNTLIKLPIRIKNRAGRIANRGIRQGAHYQIGESILYLIGAAIANKKAEQKNIAESQKENLKQYARDHLEALAEPRGASRRQKQLTLRIAEQCIDRGECYDEATLLNDMADSLQNMRPDLMIGNEQLWGDIKKLLTGVGEFFTQRFSDIKKIFKLDTPSKKLLPSTTPVPAEINSTGYVPEPGYLSDWVSTDEDLNWFAYPSLVKLIQLVSEAFNKLTIDLSHDLHFNESHMFGFFRDFSLFLNDVSTESLVQKLQDLAFIKNFLSYYSPNGSHFVYLYFMNVTLDESKELGPVTTVEETYHPKSWEEDFFIENLVNPGSVEYSQEIDETYPEDKVSFFKQEGFQIVAPTEITVLISGASRSNGLINQALQRFTANYKENLQDLSGALSLYKPKFSSTIILSVPLSFYSVEGMLDAGLDFLIFKLRKNKGRKSLATRGLVLVKPACLIGLPCFWGSSSSPTHSLIYPLSYLTFIYSMYYVEYLISQWNPPVSSFFHNSGSLLKWFRFLSPGFSALCLVEEHCPSILERVCLFVLFNLFCFSAFKLGQVTMRYSLSYFDSDFIPAPKRDFQERYHFFSQLKKGRGENEQPENISSLQPKSS